MLLHVSYILRHALNIHDLQYVDAAGTSLSATA